MREIKFRAISQLDGTWFYGSLISQKIQRPNWEDLSKLKYDDIYEICYKDENDWTNQYKNVPVFSGTIGQFTGLKDKNGKDIYEGDILKDNKGQFGKVFYSCEEARFLVNWLFKDGSYTSDACFGYGEVVGNIYENTELLEGEKDE